MALNKVFHKAPKDSHYRCHYAYPVGQALVECLKTMIDQTIAIKREGKGKIESIDPEWLRFRQARIPRQGMQMVFEGKGFLGPAG